MNILLLSALVAVGCGDGIDIRRSPEGVFDIEAKGAPMTRVIACLSELADFKVVVDSGFSMSGVVSMSVSARSSAEAIRSILDGQGLNYAYTTDPQGARVLMLMVLGRTAKASGPTPDPPPLIRSVPPSRPGLSRDRLPSVPAEPEDEVAPTVTEPLLPRGQVRPSERPRESAPAMISPADVPLYPEPRPLTPLTQSESRQLRATGSGVGAPSRSGAGRHPL